MARKDTQSRLGGTNLPTPPRATMRGRRGAQACGTRSVKVAGVWLVREERRPQKRNEEAQLAMHHKCCHESIGLRPSFQVRRQTQTASEPRCLTCFQSIHNFQNVQSVSINAPPYWVYGRAWH
eukprot:684386-Pleurochrysis_carterae.AAC.1